MYVGYKEFEHIKRIVDELTKKSFNLKRVDMPQINGALLDDFLDYLDDIQVKYTIKKCCICDIKPTQHEIDINKILPLIKDISFNGIRKGKSIILSNDLFILDGHHRFISLYAIDKSQMVDCIVVDKPIEVLINITKRFSKVSYKHLLE